MLFSPGGGEVQRPFTIKNHLVTFKSDAQTFGRVTVARWIVYLKLIPAILTFCVLWPGLAIISLLSAWEFLHLWNLSPETLRQLGFWGEPAFWGSASCCLNAAILFVRVSIVIGRRWKQIPPVAPGPSGILLSEGEAPDLFALVARARQCAGIKPAVLIFIDFSTGLSHSTWRLPGRRQRRRSITLGLPALVELTPEQLELLLAYHSALLTISPALLRAVTSIRLISVFQYLTPCALVCEWGLDASLHYASALAERDGARDGAKVEQAQQTLKKTAKDFDEFWDAHVKMVLDTGHLIPILDGFQEFLKERPATGNAPAASAVTLLRSPSAIESRALNLLVQANPNMESISWSQAAKALLESWGKEVEGKAGELGNATIGDVCDLFAGDGTLFGRRVFQQPGRLYHPTQLRAMSGHLLGAALAVALSRAGWEFLYSGPGTALAFARNGKVFEPFTMINQLSGSGLTADAWQAACADRGIANLPLA